MRAPHGATGPTALLLAAAAAVTTATFAPEAGAQTESRNAPTPGAERVVVGDGPSEGTRDGDQVVGFERHAPPPGQYVLWGEPLSTFAYAVSGAFSLSAGADLPLTPSLSLVLQAGITVGSRGVFSQFGTGREYAVVLDTAVGLSWLFVNVQRTGPVVIPKFAVQYANLTEVLGPTGRTTQVLTAVVGPGLDVGFQFAMEHVRVTLLIGGSVGYCYCATPAAQPGSLGTILEVRRFESWQPGFNLNLFRAGIAW